MRNIFRIMISIFIITNSSPCFSVYFNHFSIDDGLSQSTVNTITQDHYGFIWIGTSDGLNRYDGIRFTHFKSVEQDPKSISALTHDVINDVTVDSDGNLWISTKHGFNFFNTTNYKTKHYLHNSNDPVSISSNTVSSTTIDSQGNFWLRTQDGIDRFNPKTENFNHYPYKPGNSKYQCSGISFSMLADNENNIWFSSNTGLCRFNTYSETFEFIDYRNDLNESASYGIYKITQDLNHDFWIASRNGLVKYNSFSKKSTIYYHDPQIENSLVHNIVTSTSNLNKNQLLITTRNGFSIFNKNNETFTNYRHNSAIKNSISNNELKSVFVDHSGLVWIGSWGNGLDTFNPRQQVFKHISNNTANSGYTLSSPSVWEILKAYGFIWVATFKGFNRYNPKTGEIKQYFMENNNKNSLVDDTIFDITK